MSIGWPNASAQSGNPNRSGWFAITDICGSGVAPADTYTFYQTNVDWQPGDYVYSSDYGTRVLLGAFYSIDPAGSQKDVQGPTYNSCGV
jgi:hypothetical protein